MAQRGKSVSSPRLRTGPMNERESLPTSSPEAPTHKGVHRPRREVTRWHHRLHPDVKRERARNGLPQGVAHLVHPTHATLVREEGGNRYEQKWTSRNHRKNRHLAQSPGKKKMDRSAHGNALVGISHMFRVEYWNISWWVAQAFTWGSVIWVVNGFAAFLPFCNSHFQEADTSMGWTAFLGATVFEFGSILGMLEAWNRDEVANFGWSLREALHSYGDEETNIGKRRTGENPNGDDTMQLTSKEKGDVEGKPEKKWVWFSVDPRYFRELGFWAAFSQYWAATIFWISGFTALPQIQEVLKEHPAALNGAFWAPQVIGGSGFIISSTFIMLEAQQKWWKPTPLSLGWHVGFWNFVGGVGFTLCGALGFAATSSHGAAYQSALSTFWGGWAFLIGSVIQWYEAVNSVDS